MTEERDLILQQYQTVRADISQTCLKLKRDRQQIKLVVVSKFQPAQKIRWLLEAGQRDFGENRIEEVEEKWGALLADYPDTKLHFIGSIQSRKVRSIVKYADYIHSLDRLEIAEKIAKECIEQGKQPVCLIQVNIGCEAQKSGITATEFSKFLEKCNAINGLRIRGVMCIPPADEPPSPYFKLMQQIQIKHGLQELSMGMSNDYIDALAYGSTMVRVGSKILGSRISNVL